MFDNPKKKEILLLQLMQY